MADTDLAQSFTRIRTWLDGHPETAPILQSFNPPAPEDQLTAADAALGCALPPELKELYRLLDGQSEDAVVAAAEDDYEVGIFPSAEEGDLAFLFVPVGELVENTPRAVGEGMPGWILGWLPIGDNYGGDQIVLDYASAEPERRGRVLQFNHEYAGAIPLAASLGEYLRAIADGLESGSIRFDPECGLSRVQGIDFDEADLEGAPVE